MSTPHETHETRETDVARSGASVAALDAETRRTLRSLQVTLDTYQVCARWTPDWTVDDRCRVCGQSAWMHTARYLLSVIDVLEAPVSGGDSPK